MTGTIREQYEREAEGFLLTVHVSQLLGLGLTRATRECVACGNKKDDKWWQLVELLHHTPRPLVVDWREVRAIHCAGIDPASLPEDIDSGHTPEVYAAEWWRDVEPTDESVAHELIHVGDDGTELWRALLSWLRRQGMRADAVDATDADAAAAAREERAGDELADAIESSTPVGIAWVIEQVEHLRALLVVEALADHAQAHGLGLLGKVERAIVDLGDHTQELERQLEGAIPRDRHEQLLAAVDRQYQAEREEREALIGRLRERLGELDGPREYLTPRMVWCLLARAEIVRLADPIEPDGLSVEAIAATWTPDERQQAAAWAVCVMADGDLGVPHVDAPEVLRPYLVQP